MTGVRALLLLGDVLVEEGRNSRFSSHSMRFTLMSVGQGVIQIMHMVVGVGVVVFMVVIMAAALVIFDAGRRAITQF